MRVPLNSIAFHGRGLSRPECVLTHRSGLLFTADWTGPGGVAITDPLTNTVYRCLARDPAANLKPNGVLLEDGAVVICRLDNIAGGVVRLFADGRHEVIADTVEGAPLPPTNFAAKDAAGRLYVTVSTRAVPRHLAARRDRGDGFVMLISPGEEPRIVADGLGYTNEAILSADGRHLIVNETFGRRTSRFAVLTDGTLGPRETAARYGEGIFPDGAALDAEGGLWITSIISNTVLRVMNGAIETILQDADPARVGAVEAAYQRGELTRELLDMPHHGILKNVSSLAFGGPSLTTAYLGCLLGGAVASFEAGVAGARPAHYDADLTPFADAGVIPDELARRIL